ncbi:hypothetical protein DL95DRAFT_496324 [Leptodontidium sp. 2 PMI_412]|nr:hypothetical protein DL95DRAFT_496324 [Leptodontidium sp. 2 PMI_412]
MCITKIFFEEACGHATWVLEPCPESRGGSCEHKLERMIRASCCNECTIDPTRILPSEAREANRSQFDHRTRLDSGPQVREQFNSNLAGGHILASIHPAQMTHAEARELTLLHSQVLGRLENLPADISFWDIDRLDGRLDDHNRARVLGAALFRVPERILGEFTHAQLHAHVEALSEEQEHRGQQMRVDASRLQRARRVLAASARVEAKRLRKEQAKIARDKAIPSILTVVDIITLKDCKEDLECNICHDPLGIAQDDREAEEPCSLPCGHIFGRACITGWLKSTVKYSCPLCRRGYKTELSRAANIFQGPRHGVVASAAPLREITPEIRREARMALSHRPREGDDSPVHESQGEDLDQPAGDANFLSELAAAAHAGVQMIAQQQMESRQAEQRERLSQVLTAQTLQFQMARNRRRDEQLWGEVNLELQIRDDLESYNNLLSQQTQYRTAINVLDQEIYSLVSNREEAMPLNAQAQEDGNLIVGAVNDGFENACHMRYLLTQAQAEAEQEKERLALEIAHACIDLRIAKLSRAEVHSGDHDHLDLDEIQGVVAEDQAQGMSLEAQQARVVDGYSNYNLGEDENGSDEDDFDEHDLDE